MAIDTEALRLREIERGGQFTPIQFGDIARGAIGAAQQFEVGQEQIDKLKRDREQAAKIQALRNSGEQGIFALVNTLPEEQRANFFGGNPDVVRNLIQTDEGFATAVQRFSEIQADISGAEKPFAQQIQTDIETGALPRLEGRRLQKEKGGPDLIINNAFNQVLQDFNKEVEETGKTPTLEDREARILQKDQELGLGGRLVAADAAKRFVDKGVRGIEKATKTASLEGGLRDDFERASRDFFKSRDAFQRVQASAQDPSPAGDLALIFNFMKVLDPGSTVREGEFATAQNSGSVPDRIQNLYNRVLDGTRLTPTQRPDFVKRSKLLFNEQKKIQDRNIKRFKGIAQRKGIDFRNIIQTVDPAIEELLKGLTPERGRSLQDSTSRRDINKIRIEELQRKAKEGSK